MIIDRVEINNNVNAIYESSNIIASIFNKSDNSLRIIFKNGGSYTYSDVKNTDYLKFETAESQGKLLNTTIKKYAFIKNEPVDVEEYKSLITEVKLQEISDTKLDLISIMGDIIEVYEEDSNVYKNNLSELTNAISTYLKLIGDE